MSDRLKVGEIERGGAKVSFTEEQLNDIRDGLTAEEYWWRLIREWSWE